MKSQPTFSREELSELKVWKALMKWLSDSQSSGQVYWDEDHQVVIVKVEEQGMLLDMGMRLNSQTLRVELLKKTETNPGWKTYDFRHTALALNLPFYYLCHPDDSLVRGWDEDDARKSVEKGYGQ